MSDTPENMRGTRTTHTRDTDTTNNTKTAAQTHANAKAPAHQSSAQSASTPNDQSHSSLARRVQNSATGLARSAFQGASSNAAQTLSSATNGKSGSFPSASSAGYASQDVLGSGALSASSGQSARGPGTREAFRGGQDTSGLSQTQGGFEIPALSEEEFQNVYGSGALEPQQGLENVSASTGVNTQSSRESLQNSTTGNWKGKQRAQDPIQREYTTAWERANTNTNSEQPEAAKHMDPADGAAVVSLLSDTSFDANFGGAYGEQDSYPGANLDPDAAPPPLTAEEIKMLESFRRQIAQEEGGEQPSQAPLSSFSLIPDIDTFLRDNDPAAYAPAPTQPDLGRSTSTPLRDAVLSQLPGADEWVSVHERYHDEVWGYLRPALEAAQKEIEEKNEIDDGDGPAVRRLKMILKHMKA
ncbi:hypothetical protein N7494_004814 [Penicillium frequentans]|uniref:Uncharacterized protein n=1 Tax=Penicillium frequentans TaxID=3151616 RepID=A0AAD6GJ16_9EURO|nr:hypothetical protein N7494_004814 [Penicillium glabrum]